ncbi:MAG: glutaredoxin family protein [Actinomycetales bacterium]|nr:glutaredoxin family protein [Actinomycetales bacterium]
MEPERVLLIGKPACHLCDDARVVISQVCGRLGVGWQEVSIFDDPALYDEYWERIPVTVVDGRIVDYWRIDPMTLERALIEETSEKRT